MVFNRDITRGKKQRQLYVVVSRWLLYHIYSVLKNGKPYTKGHLYEERGKGTVSLQAEKMYI